MVYCENQIDCRNCDILNQFGAHCPLWLNDLDEDGNVIYKYYVNCPMDKEKGHECKEM